MSENAENEFAMESSSYDSDSDLDSSSANLFGNVGPEKMVFARSGTRNY